MHVPWLNETARALRDEMKNSNTVIQSKEEKKMKITTIVKVSVYAATLGFAFMLPVTAHAQMDVAPDQFAFSAPETTAAQPVQVANANATKADFEGKVSLPYAVKCGNQEPEGGTIFAFSEVRGHEPCGYNQRRWREHEWRQSDDGQRKVART
jgi:hypothetical protein